MIKRMIIMLVLCLLVLGGAFGYKLFGGMMMMHFMSQMGNNPQTVSTTKIGFQEWQNEIKAVGTLLAAKGTDIAPEVAGVIETLSFESGQDVEEGAVLLQLRRSDEQASVAALQASLKLAELTLARDDKQLAAHAISQATYDADKANVERLKAQVAQSQAMLDKKTLRAPFAGRLGLRRADIGQYVNAGTPIVTLQQLDTLYLDFSLPQKSLTNIQIGQKIVAHTDAFQGRAFEGEITAIDAKVNESTRNIDIRATIKNPEKILRSGLFATLSLTVGQAQKHLTLPQTAVTFNPYGSTVYVVQASAEKKAAPAEAKTFKEKLLHFVLSRMPKPEEGEKPPSLEARMVFVKTGDTRGDQVTILEGLKEGDEVVTSGQHKLRNGSPLAINNTIQPTSDPAPEPEDR